MSKRSARATLHVSDAPRIEIGGRPILLHRKGLAILGVLAVQGPTRRDRLADLLWGHAGSMNNLRVEIYRLRTALRPFGVEPFDVPKDPLALAPAVGIADDLDRLGENLLVGLEDLTPAFQEWLDVHRGRRRTDTGGAWRAGLVERLARSVSAPFVLVLEGQPGSDAVSVARGLARKLDVPFHHGLEGTGSAVRFVDASRQEDDTTVRRITEDRATVWILARSVFGEDSTLLTRLRAEYPPERLRFERLGPLTWLEVRKALPESVDFEEGARIYLAAHGNPMFVSELLAMRNGQRFESRIPVPQTVQAAFAVEARCLTEEARHALERLSVGPQRLTTSMIDALGANSYLDELERSGWLVYDGRAWRFGEFLARRVLFEQTPRGQRTRLTERVWQEVREDLPRFGESRQTPRYAREREGESTFSGCDVPYAACTLGTERALEDPKSMSGCVAWYDNTLWFGRAHHREPSTLVTWAAPENAFVLRLSGQVFLRSAKGVSADASASHLLGLRVGGGTSREVRFADVDAPTIATDGGLLLPMQGTCSHDLLVGTGSTIEVVQGNAMGVAELELRAYETSPVAPVTDERTVSTDVVEALDLRIAGRC